MHAPALHIAAGVSMSAAHDAPAPQSVPSCLSAPSRQVVAPMPHDVTPTLHAAFGFVVHGSPALQPTQVPLALQTMSVPQDDPADFCVSLLQTIAPVLQPLTPVKHLLGLVVQAVPAVHATHVPEPLHTIPDPQPVPADLLLPSTHVIVPVEHAVMPFLHAELGFVVHASPAVHEPHIPEPLHTIPEPQLVPADLLLPSMQVIAPVEHDVVPFLHAAFGFVVHELPAVQVRHAPVPLHTMLAPHWVPAALLVPSMHVVAPVAQDVVPFLHAAFGFVVHELPAVQATHDPEPLHTRLLPQPVPAALLVPSTHVTAPVEHDVVPLRHDAFGFVVHELPPVQATHAPVPLHTRFVPQPVPAALLVASLQSIMPVAHEVEPFLQAAFGFEVHALPTTQPPHMPMLQTWFVPQAVPLATFPVSTQTATPVTHETAPVLQWFVGWQAVPGVHAPHVPLLQTMFVPHDVPFERFCSVSEQAIVGAQVCVPA